MITKWLFLFAIPLNFIGFFLKYKTDIKNGLVASLLCLISIIGCSFYFYFYVSSKPSFFIPNGLINGGLIAAVATSGWDQAYGIKKVISELMAFNKFLYFFVQEGIGMKKNRLKLYRKKLLNNLTIVAVYSLIIMLIMLFMKKSMLEIIDYTISMNLGCIGTILLSDILNKAYFDKKKINTQYTIVFLFACLSLISFTVAFFSKDWTVFLASSIVFIVVTFLTFFLAHFSYLPSLRTQEEVTQDWNDKKWELYKTMSRKEIIEDMLNSITCYYKKPLWGADLDTSNPMFLDNQNHPQTAKVASINNHSSEPLEIATDYFETVLETKPMKEREVR